MLYRSVSHGHTHQQDSKLLFFTLHSPWLPSVSSCMDLWPAQHTRANSSWQLLSVLRPVGGKSLCPMKLQRARDIFSRKNQKEETVISKEIPGSNQLVIQLIPFTRKKGHIHDWDSIPKVTYSDMQISIVWIWPLHSVVVSLLAATLLLKFSFALAPWSQYSEGMREKHKTRGTFDVDVLCKPDSK